MKNVLTGIKRYRAVLMLAALIGLLSIAAPEKGLSAMKITKSNLLEMLYVLPPIFILLGLLDVWVPKETMMRYMGKGSGVAGVLLVFLMGSCAAGPLYMAFPIVGTLLKKNVSFFNVFVFVGAWSTTKVPMFLFETSSMGWQFSLLRLGLSVIGILVIAKLLDVTTNQQEKDTIYQRAERDQKPNAALGKTKQHPTT